MFANLVVISPSLLENQSDFKISPLDTNFGFNFLHFNWTKMLHFWNLCSVWEYISNKQFYKPDQFLA